MITRFYDNLGEFIKPSKVLIIYGARRVGKTTLLRNYLATLKEKMRIESGDNIRLKELFGKGNMTEIIEYARGYELIAIDEAQQIKGLAMGLKMIVDELPSIKIIATGSSSFEIAQNIGEPLTGRKREIHLYPIAQIELLNNLNTYDLKLRLEEFLIYGLYPEVITHEKLPDKIEVLNELVNSYLLRDVLSFENIKGAGLLLNLLKLLSFQVGQLVSVNEIANKLGINNRTVSRYLDLLEKSFVIFRLGAFSRNLRDEVTSKSKYYFYDNGIRNAIIYQFGSISMRNDIGQLWENFMVVERKKYRSYKRIYGGEYYWRSYSQKEIDLVEERDGKLFGFEFKWGTKIPVAPKDWIKHYPDTSYTVINQDNYLEFIT